MNHQRFFQQLASLYENWEQDLVFPKTDRFQQILNQVTGMTTANVMQLLNFAVECLEPNEVYCEVGCFQGASLIAALLKHPEQMAYAVDDFSEFDTFGDSFEKLTANLSTFDLSDRVFLCNQEFEEFFCELKEIAPTEKIGLYFYDAAHDYRSHLMGLLLVKPFLAERSLIVISNSNSSAARQANWDFLAAHPQCKLFLDKTEGNDNYKLWNGLQVFAWDINMAEQNNWVTIDGRRNKSFISSLNKLQESERKEMIKAIHNEAIELHYSGAIIPKNKNLKHNDEVVLFWAHKNLSLAEEKYQEVLRWEPENADAWFHLGTLCYMKEQYRDAIFLLLKSIEIDPLKSIRHYNLGVVLETIGDRSQAIQAYQEAINLNPQNVQAYNNLGNILAEAAEIEKAELVYRQAIAANSGHFGGYLNLGNLLMLCQRTDDAITAYETALKLKPRDPDILNNLGLAFQAKNDLAQSYSYLGYAFYRQRQYDQAISYFQKFLEIQTGDVAFYIALADCYQLTNQEDEALKVYEESTRLYPKEANIYFFWILALQNIGRTQEAIAVASEASKSLPHALYLKREAEILLPVIYENSEEIEYYRQRFAQGLKNLSQQIYLETSEATQNALKAISYYQNFLLQYQGKNDLEFQKEYGLMVHRIMAANYPQWVLPRSMPPLKPQEKIRIGYVSHGLRGNGVGKLVLGWLRNCDRQLFEIYCYHINSEQDALTEKFIVYSDFFHQIGDGIEAVCQQIISDRLHILVFVEVGMHPQMIKMAGLRLASVQCATWLHPVTSGLPTIDYFLSSEAMEPENAEEHYLEQLIRLPKLGISYTKQIVPEQTKSRSDFQLRDDKIVYLSCQSLSKYLPQHDYIFPEIARRLPESQFVFIANQKPSITAKFQQRLKQAFDRYGLNSEDYCVILPRQTLISYWQLNLLSDIFLDTFSWSGGVTTLEAIACNLPIVTCPGELMRSRQSYGMLKILGLIDTIAKDEAEYIDIAVKLGWDAEWRRNLSQQMSDRHANLYEDVTCVKALEQFYQQVVQEKLATDATVTPTSETSRKKVLHVGCGSYSLSGLHETFRTDEWQEVRLDIDPNVKPDIISSITDMSSVSSQSFDAIWSSHNIEHIYHHEVAIALAEFYRVLKPGGFVLITLPDIQKVAEYVAEGNLEQPLYTSPSGPISALDILYGFGADIAKGKYYMAHRTGFTQQSLALKIQEAGFHPVEVNNEELNLWATAYKPMN
ncbi:tetratricopeptide repeat protein [Microcoleus sp. herbarium14]|uniref:tetratricopeptide repeat protein n=1 Tax=Microcoleus sp. herbarium14 TaxID=3055439 RepID=UPI002FCF72F0